MVTHNVFRLRQRPELKDQVNALGQRVWPEFMGHSHAGQFWSTLFTTFTGGSGVTIMALGGLLLPILLKDGYPEGFSLGLVTASGSLGLLLPHEDPQQPVGDDACAAHGRQRDEGGPHPQHVRVVRTVVLDHRTPPTFHRYTRAPINPFLCLSVTVRKRKDTGPAVATGGQIYPISI